MFVKMSPRRGRGPRFWQLGDNSLPKFGYTDFVEEGQALGEEITSLLRLLLMELFVVFGKIVLGVTLPRDCGFECS